MTPVALHANLLHLLTNNYSLNSLGPAVEMLSGRPRFLSVYAAAAVAGSAASFAFSPAASVGASGGLITHGPSVCSRTSLTVFCIHELISLSLTCCSACCRSHIWLGRRSGGVLRQAQGSHGEPE